MPYAPADRLGPYEIVGPIGAGGMGDVYKARDTRLERSVAIKVSKEAFTERFRNEALAIAALNHPHICTLHDVGPDYLVMEYVEGRSAHGPLPVPEAMRLAGQIADALEHAHQKGVVHRDLKPSNILLTKSGVKVLDFGLAKRLSQSGSADETGPTLTEAGTLVGTPRYMAPEQIDGKPADERTDIFAFGLVLYEMLTGQRAFEGKSAPSVMAAILAKDPTPILALKPETPPALAQVVETCLAKDPAERWQSVRELKHALAWAARPAAPSGIGRRGWIGAAAAAAVVLVIVSGAALALRRSAKPPRPQPVRLPVTLPPTAELFGPANVAVSPDGQRLALVLSLPDKPAQLFVRPLDALAPTAVLGGEIGYGPFWSHDSQHIALWGPTGLRSVDLGGGAARSICKECRQNSGMEYGATWGTAEVIVYSDLGKLFRVPAEGGEPEPLAALVPGETRAVLAPIPAGRPALPLPVPRVSTGGPGDLRRSARLGPAPARRGRRVRRGLLPSRLPALHQGRCPGRSAVRRKAAHALGNADPDPRRGSLAIPGDGARGPGALLRLHERRPGLASRAHDGAATADVVRPLGAEAGDAG